MSDARTEVTVDQAGEPALRRRTVLRGVAVGGVGSAVLVACGSDDGGSSGSGGPYGSGGQATEEPTGGGATDGSGSDGDGKQAPALGSTSEVPVGGGMIYADANIVVTQPSQGEFVGFTATCTHQGCQLASVSGGTINCNCHGSQFAIEDGSVASGPATEPLGEESITVRGNRILRG